VSQGFADAGIACSSRRTCVNVSATCYNSITPIVSGRILFSALPESTFAENSSTLQNRCTFRLLSALRSNSRFVGRRKEASFHPPLFVIPSFACFAENATQAKSAIQAKAQLAIPN